MRYSSYPHRRSSFFNNYFPSGVKWLLISNVGVFLLTSLFGRWLVNDLPLLDLAPVAVVKHFALWQLVTYLFLHGSVSHLLFNMLALWMFGVPLERTWGTRRFLKYYFLCGIGAGLCDVALHAATGNWNTRTIGASGAIFGLLMAFGVLFPNQTVLMDFLFPIKAKYMVMIYGAVALYASFQSSNDGVSNIAHLGGMIFGYIYLKGRVPHISFGDWHTSYKQWKLRRAKDRKSVV